MTDSAYQCREHGHATNFAPPAVAVLSPAEQSSERLAIVAREVDDICRAVQAVRAAHAANDAARWQEARHSLDLQLASAKKSLASARTHATPEQQTQVAAAEAKLTEYAASAATLTEPPLGWAAVSREAEILAIATSKQSWSQKWAALVAEIDQLSVIECHGLATRMQKQHANDPVATALAPGVRITQAHRDQVVAYLGGARKREATRPVAQGKPVVPVVVEHEPFDVRLRQILESGDADVETELIGLFATLDGTTRRALARRLETYRQGSGDDIAARFTRLDRTTKLTLLDVLQATSPALPSRALMSAAPLKVESKDALPVTPKEQSKVPTSTPVAATSQYLGRHSTAIWNAVRARLGATHWATGSDRIQILDQQAFVESVVGSVQHRVLPVNRTGHKDGSGFDAGRLEIDLPTLDTYLYPFSVHDELAPYLPIDEEEEGEDLADLLPFGVGAREKKVTRSIAPRQWIPAIGIRVGQLMQTVVARSLTHMSQRYLEATDARAEEAAHTTINLGVGDLIVSTPLDHYVSVALVTPGMVNTVPPDGTAPKADRTKRATLRPVTLRWETDPRLWTWVRADRADATAEEVAAKLFGYAQDGRGETSYFAYGIASAAPLFGLPASWAVMFPDALAHAPAAIKSGALPDPKTDSIPHRLAQLASSDEVDAVALQQAQPIPHMAPESVRAAIEDTLIQLVALRSTLIPWGLGNELTPVLGHAVRKRDELRVATPHDVQTYAAVFLGERERLARIAGSVAAVVAAGSKMSAARDAQNPVREILELYTAAAASAELATSCEELIGQAQAVQRNLTIKSLQANQLAAMQAMESLHAGPAMREPTLPKIEGSALQKVRIVANRDKDVARFGEQLDDARAIRELGSASEDVQTRARHLENAMLQGGEVDAEELERVQLDSQEVTLNANVRSMSAQLDVIAEEANEADDGLIAKVVSSAEFRGLAGLAREIRGELVAVRRDLVTDQRRVKPKSGDAAGLNPPALDISATRAALSRAQARLEKIKSDRDLRHFMKSAYTVIKAERLRTAVGGLMAQIGFATVSAGLGESVSNAATATMVTAEGVGEAAQLSLAARSAIYVAGVVTESAANTVAQKIMMGGGDSLVENLILTIGMRATSAKISGDVAVARAFHKQLDSMVARLDAVEARTAAQSSKLASVARSVGSEAIAISGHTIMGMALGAIASRVDAAINSRAPQAQGVGVGDELLQAAATAVGRLVHARNAERHGSIERLAHTTGTAESRQLVERSNALAAASVELIKTGHSLEALDVLLANEELVEKQIAEIDKALANLAFAGDRSQLALDRAGLQKELGDSRDNTIITVKLTLVGLRELGAGRWSGSPAEVARGVREIERTRSDLVVEHEPGVSTVRQGDKTLIELYEVSDPAVAQPSTRPPEAAHELATTVVRVPGSQMRGGTAGTGASPEHTASLLAHAQAAIEATPIPGTLEIERYITKETKKTPSTTSFLMKIADGSWTSIEVVIARTDGTDTAHFVPNSSRVSNLNGKLVRGEHVLQISERLPEDQVDRVVAHGVARMIAMHERAVAGQYPAHALGILSPDDLGRIAEIQVLARTARSGDIEKATHARTELVMLTEYLGLRGGTPEAAERRVAIDAELRDSAAARAELTRAVHEPMTDAQRKAAVDDLAAEQADHQRRTPLHDAPPNMTKVPGQRVSKEELKIYASVARRLRHAISERTLTKYRELYVANGNKPIPIDRVQRGAGAALAGRDPSTLLVDARGRWQADGADAIAQLGQQLQEVYRARVGDVREFAAVDQRVPLEAVQYIEDSIAAQGEVIDGTGTLRSEGGKLLLEVVPTDGSPKIVFEVGGTVTSSTGFPDEKFLGAEFAMSTSEAILLIDRALRKANASDPVIKTALEHLGKLEGVRDSNSPAVLEAIRRVPRAIFEESKIPNVDAALKQINAYTAWSEVMHEDLADGQQQILSGKEVNTAKIRDWARKNDSVKRHAIFAGAGGNAVSGAEILLSNTRNVDVTLVARNKPDGLFQNVQFRTMGEHYGDQSVQTQAANEGIVVDIARSSHRLHIEIIPGLDFATPAIRHGEGGKQEIEMRTRDEAGVSSPILGSDGGAIQGDLLIASPGSVGQLPPDLAMLAYEARRTNPRPDKPGDAMSLRPVWIKADFASDGRYLGYTVHIRVGATSRAFEVRGAATRYAPKEEFERMGANGVIEYEKIEKASKEDAHSKSGNFDAGFQSTVIQTANQHTKGK